MSVINTKTSTIFDNRDDYAELINLIELRPIPEHLIHGWVILKKVLDEEAAAVPSRKDRQLETEVLALVRRFAPCVGIADPDRLRLYFIQVQHIWVTHFENASPTYIGFPLGPTLEGAKAWLEKALAE